MVVAQMSPNDVCPNENVPTVSTKKAANAVVINFLNVFLVKIIKYSPVNLVNAAQSYFSGRLRRSSLNQ